MLLAELSPYQPFPRGPGLYFHLVKLFVLLLVFLAWVRTCGWVNEDATELNLQKHAWNAVLLGAGVFGLLLVWALSAFGLGLLALLLLYVAAALAYVYARDQYVPVEKRLLTEQNLQELVRRGLTLQFRQKKEKEPEREIPVRLIGRGTGEHRADPLRAARVGGSKGHRAAQQMIADALQKRATEVQLEPTRKKMTVRFRVDGVLLQVETLNKIRGETVINVFKVLSALDVGDKRKAQEGSLTAEVEGRTLDVRVSTDDSAAGEKMVLRLLDRSQPLLSLTELGMRDKIREQVQTLVKQAQGMFLVCGPASAGKSTTLYACLNEIDCQHKKVLTLEAPIERPLPSVTQIDVNLKGGKTYTWELRNALRQEPDVLLIGEVRDKDTAVAAFQTASANHLVLTTLDAGDTVGALGRLIELGVQPALIAGALKGVLAQRLVRVLCPACKVRYKPNPDLLRKANLPADKIKFFYRPPEDEPEGERVGPKPPPCGHCGATGYHGRVGVFELLLVTDKVRELIGDKPDLTVIKQEAVKLGMRYLYEDGIRQVVEGQTSIQELLRVCK